MKVLLISHNPISTVTNMGKTFLSLFESFEKDELCQLYIYPSYPNVDKCSSYYRVTDKEILKSYIPFKKAGSEVSSDKITASNKAYEIASDESLYRNVKNKSALRRILRDAMWSMSEWYNSDLKAWLEKEKPTCIFVAPGVAKFIHKIALKISKELSIPIITYICDEYYFVEEPKEALDKLRLKLLKKAYDRLIQNSKKLVVISKELEKEYFDCFKKDTVLAMTGATVSVCIEDYEDKEPDSISYFGNIRCQRFISLSEIGKALDAINEEKNKNYVLKIFTAEKDESILKTFDGIKSIKLCGYLSGEAFEREFKSSSLLLHTEAFDKTSIDRVKHSVSTKIADSLASGIPLIAYGPEEVSSIKHLQRNGCAILVTEKGKLKNTLLRAFSDRALRENAVANAYETAQKYHVSEKTSEAIKEIALTISK